VHILFPFCKVTAGLYTVINPTGGGQDASSMRSTLGVLGVHTASKRGFHFGLYRPIYRPKVNSNCADCTRRFQRMDPYIVEVVGRGSSGDTVTHYGMGGPGIESRLGQAAPVQPSSGAHPASWTMGTGLFPRGKAAGAWR
jgi:hypothetical protein